MMYEDESDIICYVCEKSEVNSLLTIECANCSKCAHFRCKKLFGKAVAKARKKPYLCSVECAKIHACKDEKSPALISEIRLLGQAISESQKEAVMVRKALELTRMQLDTLVKTSKGIEDSQQFLSNQFDDLRAKFIEFREEIDVMKEENNKAREEFRDLHQKYHALLSSVDSMESKLRSVSQAAVANKVVILGLPLTDDEDLKAVVCDVGTAVGIELSPSVIENVQRIFSKRNQNSSVPILVSFSNHATKEKLFECKRRYGALLASTVSRKFEGSADRVIIRDEMTIEARNLFWEAKNMQAALNMKYIWPGRDGKVLLRRCDGGKVHEVGSKLQLLKLSEQLSQDIATVE